MAQSSDNFLHTPAARIVALVIGVGMFAIIFGNWSDDIQDTIAALSDGQETEFVAPVNVERVTEANPALEACLEERLGHVEQMQAEGIISDKQAGDFSARATALCTEQHQS